MSRSGNANQEKGDFLLKKQQGVAFHVKGQQSTHVHRADNRDVTVQLGSVDVNESLNMDQGQDEEDACNVDSDVERPPNPTLSVIDAATPEAHAVAVDELREAKMMEIYNTPLVEGELLSPPGYAKWLLPMSMTCAFLSFVAIVCMVIFVFVVEPDDPPMELASMAPSYSPVDWPIQPEANESDGASSSASSSSTSLFGILMAAIVVPSVFTVGFLVCFCMTRARHSQKRRCSMQHNNDGLHTR